MNVLQRIWKVGWLRWRPTRETGMAFGAGLAVIALSILLLPFRGTAWGDAIFFVLHDLVMIVGFGFLLPLTYTLFIKGDSLAELGLTRRRWLANLAVNIVLATLLAFQFASETSSEALLTLTPATMGAVFYIMVAGIFEMLFFYGFLQLCFERAFGIIPAIALAAVFYSLHHIGFQIPFEADPTGALIKLFLVGVMYMSTFRISRSLLIIYPFFWGVGACYDVLVAVGVPPEAMRWSRTLIMAGLMVLSGMVMWYKASRRAGG